jgi:hypothetical protein
VRDSVRYFGVAAQAKSAWDIAYFPGSAMAFYNNGAHGRAVLDARGRPALRRLRRGLVGDLQTPPGDAPLRYAALAILADERMVRDRPSSWVYEHRCRVTSGAHERTAGGWVAYAPRPRRCAAARGERARREDFGRAAPRVAADPPLVHGARGRALPWCGETAQPGRVGRRVLADTLARGDHWMVAHPVQPGTTD